MSNELLHNIVLIIHIFGVFILLVAITISLIALIGMRRATTVEGLRAALYAGPANKRLMPIATLVILGAGIWLAFIKDPDYNWHSAWIVFAFFMFLVMAANGFRNLGPRMGKVGFTAATSKPGPLPPKLKALANDPKLHYPAWFNFGLVCAFVVLMVGKPGWLGSLITILTGIILGLAACRLVEKWAKSATN